MPIENIVFFTLNVIDSRKNNIISHLFHKEHISLHCHENAAVALICQQNASILPFHFKRGSDLRKYNLDRKNSNGIGKSSSRCTKYTVPLNLFFLPVTSQEGQTTSRIFSNDAFPAKIDER